MTIPNTFSGIPVLVDFPMTSLCPDRSKARIKADLAWDAALRRDVADSREIWTRGLNQACEAGRLGLTERDPTQLSCIACPYEYHVPRLV